MERFEFDLVFGAQHARLAVWPVEQNEHPAWRASLRELPDGRHALMGDAPTIVCRWPEEALGCLITKAARWLLPLEVTKAGLPLPVTDPPLRALPVPTTSVSAAPVPGAPSAIPSVDVPRPTRKERAAQLVATVDAACERLAEQLAAGHTEAYLQFLAFHAKFHRYSPANALLIQSQCPEASRVAGLSTWNKLGLPGPGRGEGDLDLGADPQERGGCGNRGGGRDASGVPSCSGLRCLAAGQPGREAPPHALHTLAG
ncbi:MAG: ArdC-like ssDNA-binding domain-containing protein [Chloroflexota bacterium]|nr:ArdC-like ssDNA-binding domain-containing protein [Chloroflexota bacterium]